MWLMGDGRLPRCDMCGDVLTETFSLLANHLHRPPPPPQVDPVLVEAAKLATAFVRDAHRQVLSGMQHGARHWKRRR
jgi:hypothetical protein